MAEMTFGSVFAVIDRVNEAAFFGKTLTPRERRAMADAIAARQGLPGSYCNMFAPDATEREKGIHLFTGERVPAGTGASHILGEEACRALVLLKSPSARSREALASASRGILEAVERQLGERTRVPKAISGLRLLPGMYCCPKCSCAVWRHLVVRDREYDAYMRNGVRALRAHRDGKGGWRGWPFHYTLLALSEMEGREAVAEIRYAAGACKAQLARRASRESTYQRRRRVVMERALAR